MSWMLEKYAYLYNDKWIQVDRGNGVMHLILQGSLLLVIQVDVALESIPLIHTNSRGLARGSTILFLVSNQQKLQPPSQASLCDQPVSLDKNKIRKFRVKFSSENEKSAEEQKTTCIAALQGFMTIHEIGGGSLGGRDNCLCISSLKEVAQNLLKNSGPYKLPGWDDINILLEEELSLERAIRLCLLDPSFPVLVQQIEEKLQKDFFSQIK